jgi:UDPglucose 6-dehydrogenase
MKIAVAGTGYVGLVTGVCLAEKGNNVVCVDINKDKIESMKNGHPPIYEKDLEKLMNKNIAEGRLDFTTDYKKAYRNSDVVFIGVGTPEREDGSANLTYVFDVAKQIAQTIENNCLVVVKSTVPIGTNDEVEKILREELKHNVNVEVASNPEFLAQGTAIEDTFHPSRIVIGVNSDSAKNTLTELYKNFEAPMLITDRRSAEMVKYASNDFLALKISYINDIANLCETVGANIEDVTKGMSYDSRIGDKFLKAGCGYGGSCFPKDTKALHFLAQQGGYELKTVKAAIEINKAQKLILLKKARTRFGTFNNINVAVLGLTFKPNTDDLREAPSLDNIAILIEEGANITAYDPIGMENYKKIYPTRIKYANSVERALADADVCFIFTEWDEFKKITADMFKNLMKYPIVYDGRNLYKLEDMQNIEYYSIGRK